MSFIETDYGKELLAAAVVALDASEAEREDRIHVLRCTLTAAYSKGAYDETYSAAARLLGRKASDGGESE